VQVHVPLFGPTPTTVSLPDLEARCVNSFPDSTSRPLIWDGFKVSHDRITADQFPGWLWISGEFVTCSPEPQSAMVLLRIPAAAVPTTQQNATVDWLRGPEVADSLCDTYFLQEVDPSDPAYEVYRETEELIREEFCIQPDGSRRGYAIITL